MTARPSFRLALAACCAALAAPALAAAAPPIPQDPAEIAGLDTFSGRVAQPRPVRAPRVPRHPYMAANGRSNVHNDAYQTDTYRTPGPLGRRTRTFSQFFGGPIGLGSCGITIAFDRRGRLVTTCVTAASVYLRLMNPRTLDTIDQIQLPDRVIPPGLSPFEATGGAYFYLDHRDRAVVSIGRQILTLAFRDGSWRRVRSFDLTGVLPADEQLNSALPDWDGRLWFVSRNRGIVGAIDRSSGRVLGTRRTGEAIGNSFAVDDSGGVFVVTDAAQYRFDAGPGGRPEAQLARALRQRGDQEARSVRRRLRHHAHPDGPPPSLDHRQRGPDAGGGDAP